ncbi:MAG: DNA methylase, partial [Proteobacteria bacterium]|nr:DNA methylase [Pseudomonadota bacterium]
LKRIRDEKLYKVALFDSFECYVRRRWEMGKSQAYRLIEAGVVVKNLSPIGDVLPANEAQARALSRLPAAEQRKVWRAFLKSGVEQTASNIKRFIRAGAAKPGSGRKDLTGRIGADYKKAVLEMMEQINRAKSDGWRATSRQAALLWNRAMKDKILSKR